MILNNLYENTDLVGRLGDALKPSQARVHLAGVKASLLSVLGASVARPDDRRHLFIAPSKEDAYYLLNDLEELLEETTKELDDKRILFFPTTYRRPYQTEETDTANSLQRTEVVKRLAGPSHPIVVTFPEALSEKVISQRTLASNTLQINRGSDLTMDFVTDMLQEYEFDRVDFVVEPGQFAIRGGIIDVFSYANEHPYRIEFMGDTIDSLRSFDPVTQLSINQYDQLTIIPNLATHRPTRLVVEEKVSLLHYFGDDDVVWVEALMRTCETIDNALANARKEYAQIATPVEHKPPEELYSTANDFLKELLRCKVVESGSAVFFNKATVVELNCDVQPLFHKQFDMLVSTLVEYKAKGYVNFICTSSDQQRKRFEKILNTLLTQSSTIDEATRQLYFDDIRNMVIPLSLHGGFVDHDNHIVCFTDHQIFERYHKYKVRDMKDVHEALTLKELFELKPGDYVTHIDYGVGRFAGLEMIENNGRQQEVIRLVYKNNDTLYISIHGLHKISRYVGKEGVPPTLNRLGSSTWQVLKQRTKKQVKDIAKDLIALYAKRKASQGFAYSADGYLQNELEASFMYEDTPDQLKATRDVKDDMESSSPMDRLVCGDVGFGKTEVAIRAAFKAVCDSKQVAVLVPSTILAFQHYNTFVERLHGMPVNIDYLNRFRTAKERTQILNRLAEGKIDIIIGTHALTNTKVQFKDLGLLIIDEEQKFGVAVKEKLRQMRVNVDCLTLTATPIPRTLQFSLMGARDLSVIQTPPPNRQPIQTELVTFSEEVIRDAIRREMGRNGQVFFVSNRVENLDEMAGLVARLVPDAVVAVAHGQMDGKVVEETLMRFIEGDIDVLVATSIVENGLDIPNANTMIINNAQSFGLADLHQMRGRVGRSNRKAYCYMLIPSYSVLTDEAQKRLKAIEEFSTVGCGFNLAMRDLDIRGAGNILGAEQSGFISEIGYDMYHKILNEAIDELKETEFRDLFRSEREARREYVRECVIETDLEVLIPDDYVTNVSERLLLYKELNDLTTAEELDAYRERLIDRFGPVPVATQELIQTITLRTRAKEFGIEKLVLKVGKMVCFFSGNLENPFYSSDNFNRLMAYAATHPRTSRLREEGTRCSLSVDKVDSIRGAIRTLDELTGCNKQ